MHSGSEDKSPVEYDIVVSLLSGQFISRRDSGDGQQRLQEDRQTVIDSIRHLDFLIAPAADRKHGDVLQYSSLRGF